MKKAGMQIGFPRPFDIHWFPVAVKQEVYTASSQIQAILNFFFCLTTHNKITQPQCSPAQLVCYKSFEIPSSKPLCEEALMSFSSLLQYAVIISSIVAVFNDPKLVIIKINHNKIYRQKTV